MSEPPPVRKIIHVDMDAFYASVEQRDDPSLRGRPVAVGGSRERGVVAAASYEARRFGVRSAMASATARRRCPELVFVRPRFEVYKAVSRQVRAIFAEYTPLIEPLSLDEAYLDVTSNLKGVVSATLIAQELRARIREETQLTASAGVSYNKFLAKIASDQNKPDGLFVIPPSRGAAFVEALEIGRFHGVGPVTARKMQRLGIFTGGDLRARSREELQRHFGRFGDYLYGAARGIDERAVCPDRPRKSIGSETTFPQDLLRREDLVTGLLPSIDSVWAHCDRNRAFGRTVRLKAKYADFRIVTRSRTFGAAVTERDRIEAVALDLLEALLPLRTGVRLLGVTVSNFGAAEDQPAEEGQLTLSL